MTVREFLARYDGNVEIAVGLYDTNTGDHVEFLHDERCGLNSEWKNATVEGWHIIQKSTDEAAYKLEIEVIS